MEKRSLGRFRIWVISTLVLRRVARTRLIRRPSLSQTEWTISIPSATTWCTAWRSRSSQARSIRSRPARRAAAYFFASCLAWNACYRPGRYVRLPVLLPRTRGDSQDFRDVRRAAHDDELHPHRRDRAGTAGGMARGGRPVPENDAQQNR